ncbi:DNA polymerase III subunit delta' [Wolbachia endosymbiont of Pentalonia nigronervosa]|uniref:DNA polymerase III subunit delta' n=1 Tax=Wolbachia endosymbiont of Pentalonia nigronervosa TaxID=1301914 RepID=UPI00165EFD16|nr:DNA polymerase III subunit delta' [Wolbachia endosymbiont of Pentalonia nigronervosa]MBD0391895.1 DNA polymerase III subunit delta' [Wolbachia endosymbiont of Pentalonia nigronervosa]
MEKLVGHNQAREKLMNNLSIQSWIVCGKRGIGKATLVKSFAHWLLTKNCDLVTLDLHIVEGDTIGIDKIREMKNFLHLSSIQSKYRVAIIDSLEAMTDNAKNAMLKILEEPPKNSKIFIISHRSHNIQTTIKCRCFLLNLLPLTYGETKQVVCSQYKLDDKIFDEMVAIFPGAPGMIINAINSNIHELYRHFYTLLHSSSNPEIIDKIINSNVDLEIASYIIRTLILKSIKKNTDSIEVLLSKWKKVDELLVAAGQLHLDKKHVLANVINIVTLAPL